MIKNSIVNKNDKRHIEAETDLKDIIDYMKQKYIYTEDLIGSSINHLIRLSDPETLQSTLWNSEEILRTLRKLDRIKMLSKIESNYLMILEAKAFDPDGRMRYLMKKRTEVDGDHHPLSTSTPKGMKGHGDLSLVKEFNLTGGVRNALSKSKVEEQVSFFYGVPPFSYFIM